MKKLLTICLCLVAALTANAQLEFVTGSFHEINRSAVEAGSDLGSRNMTDQLIKDWPDDANGDMPAALIRAVFSNVPDDRIRDRMSLSISGGYHVISTEFMATANGLEMWTFVDPTQGRTVDLTYRQDGNLGSAIVRNVAFESKKIYTLEINNKLRLGIHVETNPAGLGVQIDGTYYGDTPLDIPEMTTGEKRLVITVPQGADIDLSKLPTSIRVDQTSTNFNFDLRRAYDVTFTSNESGTLYIDERRVGNIPITTSLHAGTYNVRATGANGVELSFPINVDATLESVPLVFTPSLNVNFAAQYDGRQVTNAHVYITNPDGTQRYNGISNFFDTPANVLLPYGKYRIKTTYTTPYGSTVSKSGKLDVNNNTDPFYLADLPINSVHHNIFNRDFPRRSWGLSVSYLSRWYSYKVNGRSHNCDLWGDDSKQSGIQFGIAYQPYFGYGLGLSTGFFGQYFWTEAPESASEKLKIDEWDLFVPLHLMFRLPIKDYDFHVNTGVGFEYGASLKAKYEDEGSESIDFDDNSPRAFNMYYEIGAGFRVKALQINFVYGLGLTKSKNFLLDSNGNYLEAKPNKLGVTLGLMF